MLFDKCNHTFWVAGKYSELQLHVGVFQRLIPHPEHLPPKQVLCLGTTRSDKPQQFPGSIIGGMAQTLRYRAGPMEAYTSADAFYLRPLWDTKAIFRIVIQCSRAWCPECRGGLNECLKLLLTSAVCLTSSLKDHHGHLRDLKKGRAF